MDLAGAAEVELRHVAALIDERAEPLTSMLVEQFGARIPELPHDPALMALLEDSAGSNLRALVELLGGRVAVGDVRAPAGRWSTPAGSPSWARCRAPCCGPTGWGSS